MSELQDLREENERLRKLRDAYKTEAEDLGNRFESIVATRLRVLADSLSQEIRERFFNTVKLGLWMLAVLLTVATAGGLWKLSDIITERVDLKVKEKEKEVAQVRESIIKALVDFERQSATSLEEIAKL